jgi:sugar transferase (PEP-CTERM system associated)
VSATSWLMISVFNQYVSVKHILLICFQSLLIVLSIFMAARLRFWNQEAQFLQYAWSPEFVLHVLTVFVVIEGCCFCYNVNASKAATDQFLRLAQALGVAYVMLCLLSYFFPTILVNPTFLLFTLIVAAVTIMIMRASVDLLWHATTREKNVLILGDGPIALAMARELERRTDLKMNLVGFLTPGKSNSPLSLEYPVLHGKDKLRSAVQDRCVSRIIIALDDLRGVLPVRELVRLRVGGVEVEDAQSALAALTGRVWLQTVRPSWFLFSTGFRRSSAIGLAKRSLDVSLSLIGLVVFFPVMCLIAIAIWLDSSGPVFYRQVRVGLGGRTFEVIKFRSMQPDAEAEYGAQWAQEGDPRITRVGRFLRKYRLDELPQFLNVLRGEMSLVGPRPERPVFVEQLRELVPFYDERHSVRPGVTGWAQVQYPYGSSVEDAVRKLEYDLFYLRSFSIAFDMAIIFQTVRVVLLGFGR